MTIMLRPSASSSLRRALATFATPPRSSLISVASISTATLTSNIPACSSPTGLSSVSRNYNHTSSNHGPLHRLFHSSPSPRQQVADASATSTTAPERKEEPQEMSSGEADIHSLLKTRFTPTHLQVQDVSGGCGSFYAIVIASKDFKGLNTVKQHRLVNECLKDIISGIHGLQLKTIAAE